MTDLKPCPNPWCGSTKPRIYWDSYKRHVRCFDCGMKGPKSDDHAYDLHGDQSRLDGQVIAAWNTRPEPKVKALEWEGDGYWCKGNNEGWIEEANTPFGWGYTVEFDHVGTFKADSTFGFTQHGFETPDQAKAAAQADFERRVRECLE